MERYSGNILCKTCKVHKWQVENSIVFGAVSRQFCSVDIKEGKFLEIISWEGVSIEKLLHCEVGERPINKARERTNSIHYTAK